MKRVIIGAFLVALAVSCTEKEAVETGYIRVEQSAFSVNKRGLDASGANATVTVASNRYWLAVSDAPWLGLSQTGGYGDAALEVVVAENDGDERTGHITFTTLDSGEASFTVTQESSSVRYVYYSGGGFSLTASGGFPSETNLGSVKLFGARNLYLEMESSTSEAAFDTSRCKLRMSLTGENWADIPYTRSTAPGTEKSVLSFSLKSAQELIYLQLVCLEGTFDVSSLTLSENEGEGGLVKFYEDNFEYRYYTVFEEDFEWLDPGTGTVFTNSSAGADGPNFNKQENLHGWTNSYTYVRPGFIKIGTANEAGWMQTPKLSALSGTKDVLVEFDLAGYNTDIDEVKVSVYGAGLVGNETACTLNIGTNKQWAHFSVEIIGADSTTQIRIGSAREDAEIKSTGKANRFFLDNVAVSWYEIINLND